MSNDYLDNVVFDGNITKPYLLISKEKVIGSDIEFWGGRFEPIIYQFSTKEDLEEAMKVLKGVPAKTLETKLVYTLKIKDI